MKRILFILLVFSFVNTTKLFAGGAPYGNNNTCATAINTAASSGSTCTAYTLSGSNVTGDPLATCNTTSENTSTWYSFTATSTSMNVFGDNAATSGVSCEHSVAVYSGTCGSLTQIGCGFGFDIVAPTVSGLTVGNTYYAQVSYSSGGPCGDLEVCFYACVAPPRNTCPGAEGVDATPTATTNACTTAGPTTNSPTITPAMLCAGSLENTAWYSFTAVATANIIMTLANFTCVGGGAGYQIGFFSGTCGNLSNFGCTSGSSGTVNVTITGVTAGQTVYVAIDGNAGATCTFDISATNTVPLPVKLLSFNPMVVDKTVKINWITETEVNNDFFTLEKSLDLKNFEVVDVIKGSGNTNTKSTYNYVDKRPYFGTSYYRLKQNDYDGNFEYFAPVGVIVKNVFEDVSVYPNPVTGNGFIEFTSTQETTQTISIYDISGRVVYEKLYEVKKGNNKLVLETTHLTKGMYFIQLADGADGVNIKFIKE